MRADHGATIAPTTRLRRAGAAASRRGGTAAQAAHIGAPLADQLGGGTLDAVVLVLAQLVDGDADPGRTQQGLGRGDAAAQLVEEREQGGCGRAAAARGLD
jgi:hypothetical protein